MSAMKAWKGDIDPASKTEEICFDNGDTLPALFNVDSRDIKEGKQIGKGNWMVHEAEWRGRKVAVKKFVAESTFQNVTLTSREVNRMLSLGHPNILKLLGFYLTTQRDLVLDCTMIMELMDCDLEDYIGKGPLSDDQVVYLFAEVARGMNHIHKRGCFHRDLKPKNVLLKKSIVTGFHVDVKIADFGSSELLGVGDINRTSGTKGYKAPEQFDSTSQLFPDKTDVFGFGALCFKILTGKEPYKSPKNVRETIEQLDRAALSQRNLPEAVVEMIWQCLDVNPALRPNFEDIYRVLDGVLSAIRDNMARPLPVSTSISLLKTKDKSKGVQGHDQLESILHSMRLSKEHAVHFIPDYEICVIRLIGRGSVASVYKIQWKGILYALKTFSKADLLASYGSLRSPYVQINYFETLPKLFHKNIVTFMGYSVTSDDRGTSVSIIMELQAMDLSRALFEARKHLDRKKKWMIVREIAEGMKYLHDQGVVHGDLKPGNVVLSALDTDDMVVKLIDFGENPLNCTTRYAAPEVLMNRHRRENPMDIDAKKADVYSFGILCQEVLGGAPLFEDHRPRRYDAVLKGKRPPIPVGTSPEMKSLMESCWNGDPRERPTFSEVCERLSGTPHYHSCLGHTCRDHLYCKLGLFFVFCFLFFVCFVCLLRSFGPCISRLHAWYHWKVLDEEGCTGLVLWHFDIYCKSY